MSYVEKIQRLRNEVDDYGHDGKCHLKLCLDLVLYYAAGFQANKKGIVHFYEQCLSRIRNDIRYYVLDGEGRLKKIRNDIFNVLPFWATEEAVPRNVYGLLLESSVDGRHVTDKAFETYNVAGGGRANWVRIILPLETIVDDTPEAFVDFVLKCAAQLEFTSGHAGFGIHTRPDYNSHFENGRVYAISRRFLGIDLPGYPLGLARFLEFHIKCVNWLTFVGDIFLEDIGGRKSVLKKISTGIRAHELQHGLMLQAGPEPSFGEVNEGEKLSLYQEVGRILKPLRVPEDRLGRYSGIGGYENTRRWLARFDK